jgi:two-component system response regulator (stage 0 sporulation protein F)
MIKLLVVDDEPGICDILKKTFAPVGFKVLTATNGQEALALVKKEKPKIIFLDIRMLGMSGLEVLKEIKKIDDSAKVIMVTVVDDDKTRKEAKDAGADEFVVKPFISDYLEEVVRKQVAELMDTTPKEKPHAES